MRVYEHERVQQLRDEGKGTLEINRIIKRERIEREIECIEDVSDVRRVLHQILEHVSIH